MRIVMWLPLVLVAGAATVLSFSALRALALAIGFETGLAWLLPVVIDAGAAAGCLVWLTTDSTSPAARRFARLLTWALLIGSVAGNAVEHGLSAYGLTPAWWLVVLVSAVPPAVLGAVVHLAVLVRQDDQPPPPPPVTVDQPLDDVVERARDLVAGGAGRVALARELELSDHRARQLLSQVREAEPAVATTDNHADNHAHHGAVAR